MPARAVPEGCARRASALAVLAALALPGCATQSKEEIAPEARACVQDGGRVRNSNYAEHLAILKQRANAFAACMTEHGFVLDEAKLQQELLREEWVHNSNVLGGDPLHLLMLREQELRASPALWRKAGA